MYYLVIVFLSGIGMYANSSSTVMPHQYTATECQEAAHDIIKRAGVGQVTALCVKAPR